MALFITTLVIAIILSSTQLWMFSAIPAKNSDSDWDWDWTTYNDLNECSTIGLFTINPYELNPTTPENAIKFCNETLPSQIECISKFLKENSLNEKQKKFILKEQSRLIARNLQFCEKPANPNTLLKERICYSYRSALSPIVTCGMMFVNLTSLLVDEVEESNSGIEANQTVADYICLSAKLSRECLELRTTRTCAKVLGTTFTEMTVNSQMDEEYINNYLRYLFFNSTQIKSCRKNLTVDFVLSNMSARFQSLVEKRLEWHNQLKIPLPTPFYLNFGQMVHILEFAEHKKV